MVFIPITVRKNPNLPDCYLLEASITISCRECLQNAFHILLNGSYHTQCLADTGLCDSLRPSCSNATFSGEFSQIG